MPKRIQLSRRKGYRKPEGAIVVARPSRWGNPFVVHEHTEKCGTDLIDCPLTEDQQSVADAEAAVRCFRYAILYPVRFQPWVPDQDEIRYQLAGYDLACWCALDAPCHADVLLELANL